MARVAFVMDKLLRHIGLSGEKLRAHADRFRMFRSGYYGHQNPLQ